jgi:hypothetical protein
MGLQPAKADENQSQVRMAAAGALCWYLAEDLLQMEMGATSTVLSA